MRKILLGLTGSVASILYKKLIEQLQTLGQVNVILTPSAAHFVNDLSLPKLLKGGHCYQEIDEWRWQVDGGVITEWRKDLPVLHIELRNDHSAFVIAPCSANTLAKLANGICDNLLTSVARAWDRNRPFVIAPAMNTTMWEHPITKIHLDSFSGNAWRREYGNVVIEPQEKLLACNTYGMGAMADISTIVEKVKETLRWRFPIPFNGFIEDHLCSGIPISEHPGAFGTQRKHEKHTGVDLYVEEGTPVLAVEAGKVVGIERFTGPSDGSPWWNDTDCLLVEGATGVVCYGELLPYSNTVYKGQNVHKGQRIGNVVRVIKGKEHPEIEGWKPNMLHMELYPHGTYKASDGFDEKLLQDPTPYLKDADGAPKNLLLPKLQPIEI